MRRYWMVRAGRHVAWVVVAAAVVGAVVMVLWNWLMPFLFGWPEIGYWQALGLLVLSRLLVGRFRGGWHPGMHWRHRMRERWASMTPEERERFRAGMRRHCGHGPGHRHGPGHGHGHEHEPARSEGQGT